MGQRVKKGTKSSESALRVNKETETTIREVEDQSNGKEGLGTSEVNGRVTIPTILETRW